MFGKSLLASLVVAGILGFTSADGWGIQRLRFGTAVRVQPIYYLIFSAAEENGIWQKHGLDVEWVPFRGGVDMIRAMAAKSVNLGANIALSFIQGRAGGIPIIAVSGFRVGEGFYIWIRGDSPFKEPRDLKGAKIGVSRLGGGTHAYGLAIARRLGLEKEVKFVGTGEIISSIAALKLGVIDGAIYTLGQFVKLKLSGEARGLIAVDDYLPKPWISNLIIARKEFAKDSPDVLRGVVKGVQASVGFIMENRRWAVAKITSIEGHSEEAARIIYDQSLNYTRESKIDRKALENVRNFLIEYGIISKEKMPPVEELYTEEFAR